MHSCEDWQDIIARVRGQELCMPLCGLTALPSKPECLAQQSMLAFRCSVGSFQNEAWYDLLHIKALHGVTCTTCVTVLSNVLPGDLQHPDTELPNPQQLQHSGPSKWLLPLPEHLTCLYRQPLAQLRPQLCLCCQLALLWRCRLASWTMLPFASHVPADNLSFVALK